MNPLHLNIVSFTIPYPPNYGGVIDVFYKIKALSAEGVRIHLHCFRYDREPAAELEQYCEEVFYYQRSTGFRQQLSIIPYIVSSRYSEELISNLCSNHYPILLEGIHTAALMQHPSLKGRLLIYRESNIEHRYYFHLFRSERRWIPKLFHLIESARLLLYQRKLGRAGLMLAVSEADKDYLATKFPCNKVVYLPSFHGNQVVKETDSIGKYVFFHGNLSVAENLKAASFLISKVFPGLGIPLKVAGMNPPSWLVNLAGEHGVQIIANPGDLEMDALIRDAQVNVLVTFQSTGLKLKLVNTLFNGRHVLVNSMMLSGTGLDSCCVIADDAESMKAEISKLFTRPVPEEVYKSRREILMDRYSDETHAEKLIGWIRKENPGD